MKIRNRYIVLGAESTEKIDGIVKAALKDRALGDEGSEHCSRVLKLARDLQRCMKL